MIRVLLPLLAAALLGVAAGDGVCRVARLRNWAGHWTHRGDLIAFIGSAGIYQSDVDRRLRETSWRNGDNVEANADETRQQLVAEAAALLDARLEPADTAELDRERAALRGQLGDEAAWSEALHRNGMHEARFDRLLGDNLQIRRWIEDRISKAVSVSEDECRQYFQQNHREYALPARFRVRHIFLAANAIVPPGIIETKRRTIHQLSELVKHGYRFADLVTLFSEDDATRTHDGDLNYVTRFRMPPEFIGAVEHLHVGQVSDPVETPLGLHLIQLVDLQQPRQMTFEEARSEIMARLANGKRLLAVRELRSQLIRGVLHQ